MQEHFLLYAAIFLLAAVVSVPIARRFGLGSVLGYLLAGVLIGPYLFDFVGDTEDVMHVAEFGVVLMLFLVGLELKPSLLWQLRGPIIGIGGSQVILTTAAFSLIAFLFNMPWQKAIAIGLILSLSSTAIVIQSLSERGLLKTEAGQTSFSVLLFQDIAVIPILAIFPLLAPIQLTKTAHTTELGGWQNGLLIVLVIAAIILGGHYLMRPIFRFIAKSGLREIFLAAALLLVILTALATESVGLSPALGTFLAGVVLAESEYRHELETNIEPFKGLLLGLFFISVGAGINFSLLGLHPFIVGGLLLLLLSVKFIILQGIGGLARMSRGHRWSFAFAMAQGSEFAFVLFSFAQQIRLFDPALTSLLTLTVALSMAFTPILLILNNTLQNKWAKESPDDSRSADPIDEYDNPVIIVGFGRFGQVIGRLLHAHSIGTTILDNDVANIDLLRKYGYKVFYGEADRIDLLEAAGADKAKLLVVAISNQAKSLAICELAQRHFPQMKLLVRAIDRAHAHQLLQMGIDCIYRETMGSAIDLGVAALEQLGIRGNIAWRAGQTFKVQDEKLLREQTAYIDDEKMYITKSVQYRHILADMLYTTQRDRHSELMRAWEQVDDDMDTPAGADDKDDPLPPPTPYSSSHSSGDQS